MLDKFSTIEFLRVELDSSMLKLQTGYQKVTEERDQAYGAIRNLRTDLTSTRDKFEREKKIHISTREKVEQL